MDITEIILQQHTQQRRAFAVLEEWPRDDIDGLSALWKQLRTFLELHAEAEELSFYPELVKIGTGAGDAESNEEQVEDALHDHNLLRDAIKRADAATTGSAQWWEAVTQANIANSDHMAEEERQDLADFRQQASLELRHQIAIAFLRHMASMWKEPLTIENKDPERYIETAENAAPSAVVRAAAEQAKEQTSTRSSQHPQPSITAEDPDDE